MYDDLYVAADGGVRSYCCAVRGSNPVKKLVPIGIGIAIGYPLGERMSTPACLAVMAVAAVLVMVIP